MSSIKIVSHTSVKSDSVERLINELGEKPDEKVVHYGKGVDKITQYQFFTDNQLNAIPWTTDVAVARQWLADGHEVMCRTRIRGQTGSGIQVVKRGEELPEAKVYTKYLSHKREFRVNIFKNKVVNIREKLRMLDREGDFHIRNHANGYTTAHARPIDDALKQQIYDLAEAASKVSSSDIVGVDIGLNVDRRYPFLIEVNSGPSIEGSTVREMAAAIKGYFAEKEQQNAV